MAYLALYRRLRPQTFDDVVGQEHITTTLINQIRRDQIGHAYLFTGTRGVGKTTVARLFAKAVSCVDNEDGLPCEKCESCKNAFSGGMDITELDAASNNGVDNVRDIKDNVIYPPTNGRYKVYIIDEVHMLTPAAFNALLKTLEEPPAHVVFILCTTEVHKLPQTILSRCMRFDFRLVRTEVLFELLKDIFRKEGKAFEESALYLIAQNAQGSVRDAMSLADRCLTIDGEMLTYKETAAALGAGDVSGLRDVASGILEQNVEKCLLALGVQFNAGRNPSVLARELGQYFRNLIVVNSVRDANALLKLPEDLFVPLKEDAKKADVSRLLRCAEIFGRLEGELRYSVSPVLLMEAAAVRAATETKDETEMLKKRIDRLEKMILHGDGSRFFEQCRPEADLITEERNNGAYPNIDRRNIDYSFDEGGSLAAIGNVDFMTAVDGGADITQASGDYGNIRENDISEIDEFSQKKLSSEEAFAASFASGITSEINHVSNEPSDVKPVSVNTREEISAAWAAVMNGARKFGGMIFNAVSNVEGIHKDGNLLTLNTDVVTAKLIKNNHQLSEQLVSLVRNSFGRVVVEFGEAVQRNENEIMQRLRNLTDGNIKIER